MSSLWFLGPILLALIVVRRFMKAQDEGETMRRSLFASQRGFEFSARPTPRQIPDLSGLATIGRCRRGVKNLLRKEGQNAERFMFSCRCSTPGADDVDDYSVFGAILPELDLPAFEMSPRSFVNTIGDESRLGKIARHALGARTPVQIPQLDDALASYDLFGEEVERIRVLFGHPGFRAALSDRFWLGAEEVPPRVGLEAGGDTIVLYQKGRWLRPVEHGRLLNAGELVVNALDSDSVPAPLRRKPERPAPDPGSGRDPRLRGVIKAWGDLTYSVSKTVLALSLVPSLGMTMFLVTATGQDVEAGVLLAALAYCLSIYSFRALWPPTPSAEGWGEQHTAGAAMVGHGASVRAAAASGAQRRKDCHPHRPYCPLVHD